MLRARGSLPRAVPPRHGSSESRLTGSRGPSYGVFMKTILPSLLCLAVVGCSNGNRTKPTGISIADMAMGTASGPGPDGGSGGDMAMSTTSDPTCGGFIPSGVGATCDSCLSASCCALGTACGNNMSCVALLNCIGNCAAGDSACVKSCTSSNAGGVSALQGFEMCIQTSCNSQCSGMAGPTDMGGGPTDMGGGMCGSLGTGVAACDTCLDNKCCSQAAACSNSMPCLGYLQCLQTKNCTTTTCANSCSTANPGGATIYNGLNTCLSTNCATLCM
jgi:hypothetical protein